MYKNITSVPNLINGGKKKIESYFNFSPRDIYSRIFLNHVQNETDSDWICKKSTNWFVTHPSMKYSVTIVNKKDTNLTKDLYAISLLPINFWLVKEKGNLMSLQSSALGDTLKKLLNGKEKILERNVDATMVADVLTNIRPTGYIVDCVNYMKPIILFGDIKIVNDLAHLVPHHKGFPAVLIPEKEDFSKKFNCVCQIVQWDYLKPPIGRLLPKIPINYDPLSIFNVKSKSVISKCSLEETSMKLIESYNIQDKPFSKQSMACVPASVSEFAIGQEEWKKRANFADKCVVSIDPIDAKDLDDALHVDKLPNGNYEVGVHIADVSHFVKCGTVLDKEALNRANSTYLKHKVIPMLPEILSEHLCSLNPLEDKLAFSVIFVMDCDGNVISENFMKSVIRPKMRLNYDQATCLINGLSLPELATSPDYSHVVESLKHLDKLAAAMRKRRMEGGALILDKIEVKFSLETDESKTKSFPEPIGFSLKTRGKSDFLVEEFMLLANQASANLLFNKLISEDKLKSSIGALLRYHPSPDKAQITRLNTCRNTAGLPKVIPTSKRLQEQINALSTTDPNKAVCLSYIVYFSMQMALYCCAEDNIAMNDTSQEIKVTNEAEFPFHHYGLNVPLYTHFTSPIRRYADIIVHRQIDAIIQSADSCGTALSQRLEAAHNCNLSRLANRRLNERLTSLYMSAYLNREGWRLTKAIILSISNNDVTILLPFSGIVHRCEMRHLAPWAFGFDEESSRINVPKRIRLKYVTDSDRFDINLNNGFPQYRYQWDTAPLHPDLTNDKEEPNKDKTDSSLDELENRINSFRLGTEIIDNANPELNMAAFSKFDVRIFEEFDSIIYCSDEKLQLVVELPFPPNLPEIKEDNSKYL